MNEAKTSGGNCAVSVPYTDQECMEIEIEAMYSEVRRMRAEIKRLLADRDEWEQAAGVEASERRSAHAEIGRLRAALALSQSQNYCTLCGALEDKP